MASFSECWNDDKSGFTISDVGKADIETYRQDVFPYIEITIDVHSGKQVIQTHKYTIYPYCHIINTTTETFCEKITVV